MWTEDFTKLSAGILVSMSRTIAQCPRCGRNGARNPGEGASRYIHSESSRIHPEGMVTEAIDYCELAGDCS
jgi:hypothetical protein